MIKNSTIGELIMYKGTHDTENWVLCDGKERDNEDNKYDELINMEIGEKKGNKYFPPDYNTMSLFSLERSDEDIIDLLSKQILKSEVGYQGLMHSHLLFAGKEMMDYNVVMNKPMDKDETELNAYLSSNPELEVKDISEFRDDNSRNIIKTGIAWAVCYKNNIE